MIKKILAAALAAVCLIGTGCDYYKQMPIETGETKALTLQDKIKGTWYYKEETEYNKNALNLVKITENEVYLIVSGQIYTKYSYKLQEDTLIMFADNLFGGTSSTAMKVEDVSSTAMTAKTNGEAVTLSKVSVISDVLNGFYIACEDSGSDMGASIQFLFNDDTKTGTINELGNSLLFTYEDTGSTLKITFDKGVSDDAAKNMAEMLTGMQYDGNSITLNKKIADNQLILSSETVRLICDYVPY